MSSKFQPAEQNTQNTSLYEERGLNMVDMPKARSESTKFKVQYLISIVILSIVNLSGIYIILNNYLSNINKEDATILQYRNQFDKDIYERLKGFYLSDKINQQNIFNYGVCTYDKKLVEQGIKIQCYDNSQFSKVHMNSLDILSAQYPQPIFDWAQSLNMCDSPYQQLVKFADGLGKHTNQGILINFVDFESEGCKIMPQQSRNNILNTLYGHGFYVNESMAKNIFSDKVYVLKYGAISSNSNGFYEGSKGLKEQHYYSPEMLQIQTEIYTNHTAKTIVDFGGGLCLYAEKLTERGFNASCYDGNPATPQITKFGKVIDLTIPQDLGKKFDWVQSFEVGEHIPVDKSNVFVDTLTKHAKDGILLSWAVISQGGFNHINQKANEEVVEMLKVRGFRYDAQLSIEYRKRFDKKIWFADTFMVFYRQK